MISLLHGNVVLFVERRYDNWVLQSIVAHFFYKHLFQIYLNDLICTKIPKPQTVELGDSEFFIDPKLFVTGKSFSEALLLASTNPQ